jgi:hypothetical protein
MSAAIFRPRTDVLRVSARTLPAPTLNLVFGGASPRWSPPPFDMSGPACCPNHRDNAPLEYLHRLALGIDSLANRLWVEPSCWQSRSRSRSTRSATEPIRPGRTTSTRTGHSVVEASLMIKERIEAVYEDLNGRAHLTVEQTTRLGS